MRIGWVTAICTPAIRFVSNGRAANPTTSDAAPADANRLSPYWRTGSNVISAVEMVNTNTRMSSARLRMRTCVTCLRASRLSSSPVLKRLR